MFVLTLLGFVSADYQIPDEKTVEYGGTFSIEIDNTNTDSILGTLRLEGCDSSTGYSSSGGGAFGGIAPNRVEFPATIDVDVPQSLQCSQGESNIDVFRVDEVGDRNYVGDFTLNVDPKGPAQPHMGSFLYIGYNLDGNVLRDFIITNDYFEKVPLPQSNSKIYLEEVDSVSGNEFASWNPEIGGIIDPSKDADEEGGRIADIVEGGIDGITDTKDFTDGGISSDGNCRDDPCALAKEGWKNNINLAPNFGKFTENAGTATPIIEGPNFRPEGEIIFAEFPEYYGPDDQIGRQFTRDFFICREGATMWNGWNRNVPRVVDAAEGESNQDLMQCNTNTGEWESISECEDGLDNDGDGWVDAPSVDLNSNAHDPSCNSPDDPEGNPGGCTPAVGYNGNNYVAYYGGGSDGGPQNYCSGDAGNLQTFNDWINNIPGSNGQVPSPTIYQCDEGGATGYCEGRDYYTHDEDSSLPDAQISYVEYYPTTEYFQNGITGNGLSNGEKTSSYFVNKEGWTSAKMGLDGSDVSGNGLKPSERKGAERIYGAVDASTGRHDDSFWFNEKGMVDGDGNGYGTDSFRDSWIAANAGAPNNDQISSEFFGGWAGKCSSGESWRKYQGEWQCTGAVQDWDQVMLAPNIDPGSGKETVGIVVMPYNFKETVDSEFESALDDIENEPDNGISTNDLANVRTYREAVADELSNINFPSQAPTLDTINVKCYPGSDTTAGFDKSKTISIASTDPTPVVVTGKLELSGSESYTCNWNYTSSDGSFNPVWNDGTPINLAVASDKNNALLDFFQNEREFNDLKRKEYTSSEFEDLVRDWN